MYGTTLRGSLPRVRERMAEAAARAGRQPSEIRLVVVTKGHPIEAARASLDAGILDLGENRVGELEEKVGLIQHPEVRWHMIGHIQSRKASRVAAVAHEVHSVDSVKLARRLSRAAGEEQRELPVLVQVNTSGEESKFGFTPESVRDQAGDILDLDHLEVRGLMTMAPFVATEQQLRATFGALRTTLEDLRRQDARIGSELSMGMSNDYELAIEEGSTMVRLGTVLLGKRPT